MTIRDTFGLVVLGLGFVAAMAIAVLDEKLPALPPASRPESQPTHDVVRHAAPPTMAADDKASSSAPECQEHAYGLNAACHELSHREGCDDTRPLPADSPLVVRRVSTGAPGTTGQIEVQELVPIFTPALRPEHLN